MSGPFLGAHMSTAGGVATSIERITKVEGQALQLFTKNSNRWDAKPISKEESEKFRGERENAGLHFAFSHDSYLINLGSPDAALAKKSRGAFLDEIDRAELLGLDFVVFHPGAHMGEGVEKGCSQIAQGVSEVLSKRPKAKVMLLLENAAGQGTTVGRAFEELGRIREEIQEKERVGYCFDTCHAFAAGYDLRTKEGYEATMKEFDRAAGLKHLRAFHVNDSKKGLDCRVDRHEHIGKGSIGTETFRFLLNDPRFSDHPMVLETPKSEDLHEDRENLALLRSLMRK